MPFPKFLRLVLMKYTTQPVKINSTTTVRETYLDKCAVELPSLLAKMYDFSYKLLSPTDGEIGRQLPDGNWTGMIGMLLRNEADITLSGVTVTEERKKVLDFSYPLLRSHITFITTKPDYSPEMTAYLKPFSTYLWITMISSLILLSVIFLAFLKRRYTYDKIVLAIFSSLLMQPLGLRTLNVKERVLIFSYILAAMLLTYSYTCVLLSFITFPTFTGVRTIPELAAAVEGGRYHCVTYPGTPFGAGLAMSKDPNFQSIGRNLQQNEGSFDVLGVLRSSSRNSKKAFVGIVDNFLFLREKYFISQDEFSSLFLAISFRKDFCCKEHITRFVMYMWSSGIYQKIWNRFHFREALKVLLHNDERNVGQNSRQFSLEDVAGAFFVLLAGYALSVAAFIVEVISQRFLKNIKRFSNQSQIRS